MLCDIKETFLKNYIAFTLTISEIQDKCKHNLYIIGKSYIIGRLRKLRGSGGGAPSEKLAHFEPIGVGNTI